MVWDKLSLNRIKTRNRTFNAFLVRRKPYVILWQSSAPRKTSLNQKSNIKQFFHFLGLLNYTKPKIESLLWTWLSSDQSVINAAPIKANRKSGSESSGIESGLSDRTDSENCQMLLTESAYIQVHNNQNNNSKHKKKLTYTQSGTVDC